MLTAIALASGLLLQVGSPPPSESKVPRPPASSEVEAGGPGGRVPVSRADRRRPRSLADLVDPEDLANFGMSHGGRNGFGVSVNPLPPLPGLAHQLGPYVIFFDKWSTGTGYKEKFLVFEPSPPPVTPQPMLVIFHKFGANHLDAWDDTTYVQEAAQRGWYLVCPLAAENMNFASMPSQANTELALGWMTNNLLIDPDRTYGIGFSMGGGCVTSFAARHLDPLGPRFAAIIDHTGGVALNNTYYHDQPVRFVLDYWFGDGSPGSADPWEMARSSVIDFDPISLAVNADWNMARNLLHMPQWVVRASNEPIAYLNTQCDVLDGHLQTLGLQPGPTYGYYIMNYTGHEWSMLDETSACDFLAQFSLQIPQGSRTLADRDGVYFHFDVTQDAAGAFTPFDWSIDPGGNKLTIEDTANLSRLAVDLLAAGLDVASQLEVDLSTTDGLGDEILLPGYATQPLAVLRDSLPTSSWSWSGATQELLLMETDGGSHAWVIQP